MNNENIELAKKINNIKKNKKIMAVYLFGSSVNNKQNPLSDIDICIFGEFNSIEKNEIERNFSEKYDLSFFNELPIWIKIRVLKEGRALYIKNKDEMFRISLNTMKEYEDFKPLIINRIKQRFGKCTI